MEINNPMRRRQLRVLFGVQHRQIPQISVTDVGTLAFPRLCGWILSLLAQCRLERTPA